jgi:hypothetical protein
MSENTLRLGHAAHAIAQSQSLGIRLALVGCLLQLQSDYPNTTSYRKAHRVMTAAKILAKLTWFLPKFIGLT